MLGPARLDKATGLTKLLTLAGLQAVQIVTLSPKAVYLTGNRNGYRCTVCEYDWVDEHLRMWDVPISIGGGGMSYTCLVA